MNQDVSLTGFLESTGIESHLRVQEDLGDGFVRLRSEEAERRQAAHDIRSSEDIVIEMLRNARDAQARSIFLATSKEGGNRTFTMIDDGQGIPSHLHDLIFEPRVTSKLDSVHMDKWGVHGRGMALFSVKQNALESSVVASAPGLGASLFVRTDTAQLQERADQSTFPRLVQNESGSVSFKGPRNILRTSCEFALEHRKSLSVYVGSAAEIACTLYGFGVATVSPKERAFTRDVNSLPICKRLAYAGDAAEFASIADSIGLEISTRTAYRIMDGSVKPLTSLVERLSDDGVVGLMPHKPARNKQRKARSSQPLVTKEGLAEFSEAVQRAFLEVADAYYLDSDVGMTVKIDGDTLRVSIPLVSSDQ